MSLAASPELAAHAADILKAIAHPVRLRLVALLAYESLNVTTLAERLGEPQPVVSQQLRVLRMRNLVGATRVDGFAVYRLTEPHLRDLLACLSGCLAARNGDA